MNKLTITEKAKEQSKTVFKTVLNDAIIDDYLKQISNRFSKDYFHRLTEENAIFLNEYLPNYFSLDYTKHVGEWFYVSLYGDALSDFNKVKELIVRDDDSDFDVEMVFDDLESEKEGLIHRFWNDNETIKFYESFYISCLLNALNNEK